MKRTATPTRRDFLRASLAVGVASLAGTRSGRATPTCGELTAPQIEGPYFKPDSPLRRSLRERGMPGTRLVLAGRVLTPDCRPLPHVLLDFWHADAQGRYDNAGFTLRGHQFSDASGHYRLETIVPGLYPGRTRHVHVKVQAPGGRILTTQLYFPDEPANQGDFLFAASLAMRVRDVGRATRARFDFVLGGTP